MDDHELLRDYAAHRSERAFTTLVEKHLPFVYASSLRLVRDAAAAEDVAQSVFIDLARKAWMVRPGTLPGWLYRATQRAAYMSIRTENRRRQRETAAMNLAEQNSDATTAAWETLAPLLDEALQQLNRIEQDALLLRYFDGQSMSETGRLLSLSEAAAQKRISRALDKMRAYFARRGVIASAALLATTLDTHAATQPPAGLAGKIMGPSLAGAVGQAGGAGIFYPLLQILFMSTKNKTMLAVATLAVAIAFTVGGIWWFSKPVSAPVNFAVAPPGAKPPMDSKSPALHPSAVSLPPVSPSQAQPSAPQDAGPKLPADPRAELAKTELHPLIADMISLLEAGDAEGVISNHLPPEVMAGLPPPPPLDTLNLPPAEAAKLKQTIADQKAALASEAGPGMQIMLIAYKAIMDATPALNEAGDVATYTLDSATLAKMSAISGSQQSDSPLHFYKINGQWYTDHPDP